MKAQQKSKHPARSIRGVIEEEIVTYMELKSKILERFHGTPDEEVAREFGEHAEFYRELNMNSVVAVCEDVMQRFSKPKVEKIISVSRKQFRALSVA